MNRKTTRSNQGPQARFRVFRRKDGGLRITDESIDPDGTIIARMWTTSEGKTSRARQLVLKPDEYDREIRVQLTVEDDNQASATTTKILYINAEDIEEVETDEQLEEEDVEEFEEGEEPTPQEEEEAEVEESEDAVEDDEEGEEWEDEELMEEEEEVAEEEEEVEDENEDVGPGDDPADDEEARRE